LAKQFHHNDLQQLLTKSENESSNQPGKSAKSAKILVQTGRTGDE